MDYSLSNHDLFMIYVRFTANIIIMITLFLFIADISGYDISGWFKKHSIISLIYSLVLVICILLYVVDRNYYLSFLGQMVYPCGSMAEKIPVNSDTSITVKVPPNVNVIYWASEPVDNGKQPISNPWDAYASYDNAGVVKSDNEGNAVLRVRKPSSYKVGLMSRVLKHHIHYRICSNPGMLSEIKTVFI